MTDPLEHLRQRDEALHADLMLWLGLATTARHYGFPHAGEVAVAEVKRRILEEYERMDYAETP